MTSELLMPSLSWLLPHDWQGCQIGLAADRGRAKASSHCVIGRLSECQSSKFFG